jgi:hypothetical protein
MSDVSDIFQQPNKVKTTAQVIAEELIEMCNSGAKGLVDLHQRPFNKLWVRTQELGVDPQEVLNELGDKGEIMFKLAGELVTFILGGYGNTKIKDLNPQEYLCPYEYTVDGGKITLVK